MNFYKKNREYLVNGVFLTDFLLEINNKDGGLFKFKKYCDFREGWNDLDFYENLYQSLYEYRVYGDLYNKILENFQEFSEDEKNEFQNKWNQLMNLNNKFNIKNIQDFKKMDEIEKEYYTNILNETDSISKIKESITEILVRTVIEYIKWEMASNTQHRVNQVKH